MWPTAPFLPARSARRHARCRGTRGAVNAACKPVGQSARHVLDALSPGVQAERTRIAVAGPSGASGGRPHRAQAVEETRGQLSAVVEASGDAIYTYDLTGTSLTGIGPLKNSMDTARKILSDDPPKSLFRPTRSRNCMRSSRRRRRDREHHPQSRNNTHAS